MNAAAVLKIVLWAIQAITMIVDVVKEAMAKAEPPTSEELKKTLHGIIDEKHDVWMKTATDEAEKRLREAAAAEFDSELNAELKKNG